jgi:hypothetical protein
MAQTPFWQMKSPLNSLVAHLYIQVSSFTGFSQCSSHDIVTIALWVAHTKVYLFQKGMTSNEFSASCPRLLMHAPILPSI